MTCTLSHHSSLIKSNDICVNLFYRSIKQMMFIKYTLLKIVLNYARFHIFTNICLNKKVRGNICDHKSNLFLMVIMGLGLHLKYFHQFLSSYFHGAHLLLILVKCLSPIAGVIRTLLMSWTV